MFPDILMELARDALGCYPGQDMDLGYGMDLEIYQTDSYHQGGFAQKCQSQRGWETLCW